MSQETSCPYCNADYNIPVVDGDTTAVYVRCRKCGGVFEFMPDFGSFSLPDNGQDFTPTREIRSRVSQQEYVITDDDTPDGSSCAACCCVALIILLSVVLPIAMILLFGF